LAQTTLAFAFGLISPLMAAGQQAATVPARVTQAVDMQNLVTLPGNTHPLARPEYDRGAAPDSLPTGRILLVLQRSPEQEAALRQLLDEQQIKSSANYHMWLTPEQFGEQFGPAEADIQAVTDWLTSQGFQVNHVAAGRTVIEFSGTAGAVRQAFQTEIHKYVVNGEEHWANATDPQIPAALKPVVAGFASLHNFPRRPRIHRLGTFSRSKVTGKVQPLFTYPLPCPSGSGSCYVFGVGPGDFATIYNVTPLWNASIDGTGVTVGVVADSNINIQDVRDFRTMFGLPANDPQIILNGPDPGILSPLVGGDEDEADLDVQWTGAIAKGATIDFVVSEDTETTLGVDLSALYIVDNNIAAVMNSSYGDCEAATGAGGLAFYNTIWEQGAAQGITINIASGDSGSAGCDSSSFETAAQYGLAVGGDATTPFNVAVGGTDFNIGTGSTWEQYWNYSTSGSVYPSAKSYIPEQTWNDSCANTGSLTGCASGVKSDGSDLVAGSGGESNCAYPVSVSGGVECATSGGIYGIPKPAWQSGTGVPNDQVRDIPDLSLFAGDGLNGSFYIYCEMDANASAGGSSSSCDLSAPYLDFQGAGGTSGSAQVFGGLMALVNQKTGQRQGNANYVLYPLAAKTGASCASTSTMAPTANASKCIFYDIQVGNNSVACDAGSPNCGNQSTSGYGIMVYTGGTSPVPAWLTTAGYDLATGLGTVNAANLVNNWNSVSFTPTTTTLSLSPTPATYIHGQSVTLNVGVTSTSGTPKGGDVSIIGGPNNSDLGIAYLTLGITGSVSESTVLLPGGTYNVIARYAGNGTYGASESSPVAVAVNPESSTTKVQVVSETCSGVITLGVLSITYGQNVICNGVYYSDYWLRVDVMNSSGNVCWNTSNGIPTYQCPPGTVTVAENGKAPVDLGAPASYSTSPGVYTLNSQGFAEDQFIQLGGGLDNLVATYTPSPASPNNSYTTSQGTAAITVTQAATTIGVTANPTTATSGQSVTLTALVSTASVGFAPTGAVQFLNSNVPISGTVTYTAVNGSSSGYASLTATLTTSFTSTAYITANYVADLNYSASTSSSVTVTITSGAPDFSVVASPTLFSISSPGASGTTTISITPLNGFTGSVSLSCSVPSTMTGGTCLLASASITPSQTTTLTVNTTASSTVIGLFNRPLWLAPLGGTVFAAFFLLLIPTKRRRLKLAFGSLFLVLLAAAVVACGGGSSTPPPITGTSPGTYSVTVAGTGSVSGVNLIRSVSVTVTVQ
jgi:hypothetical protein